MPVSILPISPPQNGSMVKVNEYIYWLRMPLPFDLDHINLYLIKDDDGWIVLDTGLSTNITKKYWKEIIVGFDIRITRVVVTHMHPDHIGLAGYLSEKFRVPLYMSFSEYFVARAIVAGAKGADHWQDKEHLQRIGIDQEYINQSLQTKSAIDKVVSPIPLQFKRLVEGDVISAADIQWRVLVGMGHSPEHVCLYSNTLNVLISGDHILPEITPNIGTYSTEPDADPLALYLSTLEKFYELPVKTVVLPSHKRPFTGLHDRIKQLQQHHYDHLDQLVDFCKRQRTVKDTLPVLFNRPLNPHNMFFALAEALSHLNHLFYQGKLSRSLSSCGQWKFKS